MLRAVSTYVYVKERLHPGLLDELVKAGAQSIEIFAARQHFDYANRKQHVREIADWFRSTSIPLNSVHAPLYSDYEWGRAGSPPVNIASTDRAGRIDAMDEIKRALEIAEHIPFRFLVQHIGNPNELSAPERLVEFIRTMHFDDIGVCFDCGHAHLMNGIPETFAVLKNHICSTHVHDNNKDKDSHLWPGKGSIDWKQTMELLRTAPQAPPLLLEIEGEEKKSPSEEVIATFQKLGDS